MVVLQLLGVHVPVDKLAWSQNDFSMVGFLFLTSDKCDLHLQEHPSVDKLLHLDYVQSFGHGIHALVRFGHGFLGTFFFAFLLQLVSQIIFVSWLFPISVAMRSSLLDDIHIV